MLNNEANAQNYTFNYHTTGRRVCLVSSQVDLTNENVKIIFHDSLANTNEPLLVNRRKLGTYIWNAVANLSAGTGHWVDTNVNTGDVWEYQVKRKNTWAFGGVNYDATGYTLGALLNYNTNYKGQMILLVANDIPLNLPTKYQRLKKELTNDGWYVNELIVPRATTWDSGDAVVTIKNQIQNIYSMAPSNDKPKSLFILGHVAMPRCGSTNVVAPDDHSQNTGARGCDGYYADIGNALAELLSARETIAEKDKLIERLVKDGERLAEHLTSWCEVYHRWALDAEVLEKHTALMKELEGKG